MGTKDNQTTLSTKDIDGETIPGGQLPEEGLVLEFSDLEKDEGKYGEFWRIIGFREESGDYVEIMTSSKRLTKLVKGNYDRLKGKVIRISGQGTKFDRHYDIEILD